MLKQEYESWRSAARKASDVFFETIAAQKEFPAEWPAGFVNPDFLASAPALWPMVPDALQQQIKSGLRNYSEVVGQLPEVQAGMHMAWDQLPEIPLPHGAQCRLKGSLEGDSRPVMLLVPSVLNPPWIFDLPNGPTSLLKTIDQAGLNPVVLSWGARGANNPSLGWQDYAESVLPEAIRGLSGMTNRRIHTMGYCLGGSLLLSMMRETDDWANHLASLSLWSAPAAFDAEPLKTRIMALQTLWEAWLGTGAPLPMSWMRWLFVSLDPLHWLSKWHGYQDLGEDARNNFLQVEAWATGGQSIPAILAHDILAGLYLNGQKDPEEHKQGKQNALDDLPSCIVAPSRDYLVSMDAALGARAFLQQASVLHPEAGHVGLVASCRMRDGFWPQWIDFVQRAEGCTKIRAAA